jgi:hypothetical protein
LGSESPQSSAPGWDELKKRQVVEDIKINLKNIKK